MCAWGWRITSGSTRACSPPPTPPRSPASARSSKASASRSPHPPRPAKSSRSREATMSDSDLRTPPALEPFRVQIDEDGIAHLIFDMAGSLVNVLSQATLAEIGDRRSAVWGKSAYVRVGLGCCRHIKKKKQN